MDVKFVVLLVVALAIVFLLVSEINALKTDMDKKFNEIDSILEKHNEDLKVTLKKETLTGAAKFKTYTSEMLQQIRTMNIIEKQPVMMSDHFIEVDSVEQTENPENLNNPLATTTKNAHACIPYLSEMNPTQYDGKNSDRKKEDVKNNKHIQNKDKKEDTKESGLYMSETEQSEEDQFKVKDEKNNVLNSTKMSDGKPEKKITKDRVKSLPNQTDTLKNTKSTSLVVASKNISQLQVGGDTKTSSGKVNSVAQGVMSLEKKQDIKLITTKSSPLSEIIKQKSEITLQNKDANTKLTKNENTKKDEKKNNIQKDDDDEEIEDVNEDNESDDVEEHNNSVDDESNEQDEDDEDDDEDDTEGIEDEEDEEDEQENESDEEDQEENEEDESGEEEDEDKPTKKTEKKTSKKIVKDTSDKSSGKSAEKSSDKQENSKKTSKASNVSKKLQQLKKLQAAMNSDDNEMSSQEITIGSGKKGTEIVVKSGKKSTIVDDLSIGTSGTADENQLIKLKAISSYSKTDLEELAEKHGVKVPAKSNKTILYDTIKSAIGKK